VDLLLFDIDGTLLRTRGAGRQALDEAFAEVAGWDNATEGVHIAGSTDAAIVRDVAARFGCPDTALPFELEELRQVYFEYLGRFLAEPGRVEPCPGVHPFLEAVEGRAHVALLTGNWRFGARRKLAAIGLEDRFAFGAFGDDATDRNCLVPVARARADAAGLAYRRVVVLGDTPSDVACARAGGAVAVVVETGFSTPTELARSRPDLQVPDLVRGRDWLMALLA
jgi:phosphoglycolate phosphatase-like HAD superfamily hydrolase